MPIVTKTVSRDSGNWGGYGRLIASVFAKAVAAAVGTEVKTSGSEKTDYYIPMESIGYPGWCVYFYGSSTSNLVRVRIRKMKEDGTADLDDLYRISYSISGGNFDIVNDVAYYGQSTCVMIYDENKDTVLFNVHPGSDTHSSAISSAPDGFMFFTFFFAKDINGDVLCGLGHYNIVSIRTIDKKLTRETSSVLPQKATDLSDVLHLTKMVNYLSPGCPEMKSAYVSVVRPFDDSSDGPVVKLYDVNGIKYGRTSFVDSWHMPSAAFAAHQYPSIYYLDPFVKY